MAPLLLSMLILTGVAQAKRYNTGLSNLDALTPPDLPDHLPSSNLSELGNLSSSNFSLISTMQDEGEDVHATAAEIAAHRQNLMPSDRLLSGPHRKLKPGSRVRIKCPKVNPECGLGVFTGKKA